MIGSNIVPELYTYVRSALIFKIIQVGNELWNVLNYYVIMAALVITSDICTQNQTRPKKSVNIPAATCALNLDGYKVHYPYFLIKIANRLLHSFCNFT